MKKISLFVKFQIFAIVPIILLTLLLTKEHYISFFSCGIVLSLLVGAIVFYVKKKVSNPLLIIINGLRTRVDSLNASSDQISNTAHYIGSGVKEQYRGLNVAKSIMEDVTGMVNENEKNASVARNKTSEFVSISLNGLGSIENLNSTFHEIEKGNDDMLLTIEKSQKDQERIAQMVQEIGNKTKVINDIVFQTKLLSFNASVEAARAGEHGKGFAVVAEEVGKLATLTQTAALEITQIVSENKTAVESIIKEQSKAIGVVSIQMKNNISASATQVESCSKLFDRIAEESKELNRNVEAILNSSEKQKRGFEEMSNAFISLIDSVKQNALLGQQAEQAATLVNSENKALGKNIHDLMSFIFADEEANRVNEIASLKWSSKFLLNIDDMDDEHLQIVSIINQLVDLVNKKKVKEMEACLDNLLSVSTNHFAHEEQFMQKINYPDFNSHKRIHEAILKQLGEHRSQFGTPEFDASRFIRFVQNWLLSHILGVDMQYAEHFSNNKQAA